VQRHCPFDVHHVASFQGEEKYETLKKYWGGPDPAKNEGILKRIEQLHMSKSMYKFSDEVEREMLNIFCQCCDGKMLNNLLGAAAHSAAKDCCPFCKTTADERGMLNK
jgi:truncated hemoglobin YjbI